MGYAVRDMGDMGDIHDMRDMHNGICDMCDIHDMHNGICDMRYRCPSGRASCTAYATPCDKLRVHA